MKLNYFQIGETKGEALAFAVISAFYQEKWR